jgi:hypothetical protein
MIFSVTFKSMIHFELIVVYGLDENRFKFIFSCIYLMCLNVPKQLIEMTIPSPVEPLVHCWIEVWK